MSYHLGRVGTCLWWILDNASLKMSKNCFCLCSCMRGLRPAYAACIHAYADLFLLTQVCSWGFVYVGINLRTRGSCLRVWALTYVCEMPGRSLALPIFTYFSPVSLPYAILHIFLLFMYLNITTSFFLPSLMHYNTIFFEFHLNHESNDTFSFFAVIIPLCWEGKHQ